MAVRQAACRKLSAHEVGEHRGGSGRWHVCEEGIGSGKEQGRDKGRRRRASCTVNGVMGLVAGKNSKRDSLTGRTRLVARASLGLRPNRRRRVESLAVGRRRAIEDGVTGARVRE